MEKRSKAEWSEIIEQCRISGKSQTEWCRENKINLSTFQDRKSRQKKAEQANPELPQRIVDGRGRTKTKGSSKVKWVSVSSHQGSQQEKPDPSTRVIIGAYTILLEADFNEPTFLRICKALRTLC